MINFDMQIPYIQRALDELIEKKLPKEPDILKTRSPAQAINFTTLCRDEIE